MTAVATDAVPAALAGAWRLDAYVDVTDGVVEEGPLGPAPAGLLIYTGCGRVSVSMMRTDPGPPAPGDQVRFMGYAGTWWLVGRHVVHQVDVASHDYLVGTRQVRDLALDGDLLTLSGRTPPGAGPPRRRVLTWRRATGEPR